MAKLGIIGARCVRARRMAVEGKILVRWLVFILNCCVVYEGILVTNVNNFHLLQSIRSEETYVLHMLGSLLYNYDSSKFTKPAYEMERSVVV